MRDTRLCSVRFLLVSAFFAGGSALGCGDLAPVDDGGLLLDFFPLDVGKKWAYEQTIPSEHPVGVVDEVLRYETVQLGHDVGEREVFVVQSSVFGPAHERQLQYLSDDLSRAVNHKCIVYDENDELVETRESVPGSLLLDRTRLLDGQSWTESFTLYTSVDNGQSAVADALECRFEVLSTHRQIRVPAGTFTCLVIEQTLLIEGAMEGISQYFFAPGVGKVKEIAKGRLVKELLFYEP